MNEDERVIRPKDLAKRIDPSEGKRRFLELVGELADLDAYTIEGPGNVIPLPEDEVLPVLVDVVGLVSYMKDGSLMYVSGTLSPKFPQPAEAKAVLRSEIIQFPTEVADEEGLQVRAQEWQDEGNEVIAGLIIGKRRDDNRSVVGLHAAHNVEVEEAMYLIRKAALSEVE